MLTSDNLSVALKLMLTLDDLSIFQVIRRQIRIESEDKLFD